MRLSYRPERFTSIDHVEIQSLDKTPLPITETGYRSHFFGPYTPALALDEVTAMVITWLNEEAQKPAWKRASEQSRQLLLF